MQAPPNLESKLSSAVDKMGSGPLLVHSDLLRAGIPAGTRAARNGLLQAHWNTIYRISGERDVWMPAFNYNFPDNKTYNLKTDASHVGPFSEYFRSEVAQWRTPTPIFSYSGVGQPPPRDPGFEIDPFGHKSAYQHLLQMGGVNLAYGTSLNSANIMHFAERVSGGPIYRYDKRFRGTILFENGWSQEIILLYHVRPWGMKLEYDHSKILTDLVESGMCWSWKPGPLQFVIASSRNLVEFWVEQIANDPLYLLDKRSKRWVARMLDKLGRKFELEDFESPQ